MGNLVLSEHCGVKDFAAAFADSRIVNKREVISKDVDSHWVAYETSSVAVYSMKRELSSGKRVGEFVDLWKFLGYLTVTVLLITLHLVVMLSCADRATTGACTNMHGQAAGT